MLEPSSRGRGTSPSPWQARRGAQSTLGCLRIVRCVFLTSCVSLVFFLFNVGVARLCVLLGFESSIVEVVVLLNA